MVDDEGFRSNVGIILTNIDKKLFWARRIGQNGWQFPQGGVQENEDLEAALYRELKEEIGLLPEDVKIIGKTNQWLKYQLPKHLVRHHIKPVVLGQKQIWFLLQLVSGNDSIKLNASISPEFDAWRWVEYWYPLTQVVEFKYDVYEQALKEFATILFPNDS